MAERWNALPLNQIAQLPHPRQNERMSGGFIDVAVHAWRDLWFRRSTSEVVGLR